MITILPIDIAKNTMLVNGDETHTPITDVLYTYLRSPIRNTLTGLLPIDHANINDCVNDWASIYPIDKL